MSGKRPIDRYYDQARRALDRDAPAAETIRALSFFDWPAEASPGWAIYADPPYANTTGYKGVGAFDHTAFWRRCREWQAAGVDVFVSEYSAPPDVPAVVERSKAKSVGLSNKGRSLERLYLLAAEKEQRA